MFKRIFDFFKRIFDFFKRDKVKNNLPIKMVVENPKPKEIKLGFRQGWIKKLVQRSKSIFLQKKIINKGLHEAHPRHVIKPLREIRPANKFYSSTQYGA
jgi:hypothetical protein